MKKCRTCLELKNTEHFHKHCISKDGLRNDCKVCRNSKHKAEYISVKKIKDRKLSQESYYSINKEKIKQYYLKNKEKINTRSKEYRVKNKTTIRQKNQEKYNKQKDIILLKNREFKKYNKNSILSYSKKHYSGNKDYFSNKRNERRTLQSKGYFTKYRESMVDIYKNCPEGYHVDHIVPIKNEHVCGLHVPWNLQYLTAKDNRSKKNKFDGTNDNKSWRIGV